MEVKGSLSFLKTPIHKVLDEQLDIYEINRAINEISTHFWGLIGLSEKIEDLKHLAGVPSKAGLALSFNHAADCLLDYNRTKLFLRGLVKAIKDKKKEYPNETIQIFYAGCGPFAPFATLVAPLFTPDEVQFTLLEINSESLDTAKKLVKELGLESYIREYHLADAITFKIPNPDEVHILFTEILDALLHRECYVPILWNLLSQLPKDVIVVPNNVLVKQNFKVAEEENFGTVVFDTRKALEENEQTTELPEKLFPTFLSLENADTYDSIVLDTEVEIYKEYVLRRSDSSLTLALEVPIHKPITHKGVNFVYNLMPQPSLQMEMVEHD